MDYLRLLIAIDWICKIQWCWICRPGWSRPHRDPSASVYSLKGFRSFVCLVPYLLVSCQKPCGISYYPFILSPSVSFLFVSWLWGIGHFPITLPCQAFLLFPWERLWPSMTGLCVSGLPSLPVAVSLGYSLWARRWRGGEASTPARACFPLNLASQADPWSNSDQVLFLISVSFQFNQTHFCFRGEV